MLDSGCGIDLIGLGDLSREERDMIVQNAKISLRTANGKTNTFQRRCSYACRRS